METLALSEDGVEENVVRASERVARLVEIFEGIAATQELDRRGRQAASDAATVGKLTTLDGRRGKPALRAWIAEMMPIYKKLTGKAPRISVNARRKPTGPFWRFLKAASKPLSVKRSWLQAYERKRAPASSGPLCRNRIVSPFAVRRPGLHLLEAMNAWAKDQELDAPATRAALVALVRLIACQTAREWTEERSTESQPSDLKRREKSR